MLTLRHTLIKNIPLTIYRKLSGYYLNGTWVEGSETSIDITAQVQPLRGSELLMLPESERTREWVKVYSPFEIKVQREGTLGFGVGYGDNGNDSDEFIWQGKRFRVMESRFYEVGTLQHYRSLAARIPLTPN